MKKLKLQVTLLFVSILFITTTNVFSQRGNGGWGQNSNYGRLFNPQTIETLTATVTAVEKITPNVNMSFGIHLKLKTKTETIYAHLGPAWYIDNQDIQFKKGDVITVTGSRITYQNAPAIIVIDIEKGDYILHLRNKNGFPAWSGWRKNRRNNRINY